VHSENLKRSPFRSEAAKEFTISFTSAGLTKGLFDAFYGPFSFLFIDAEKLALAL
jgi:hypothetical protein